MVYKFACQEFPGTLYELKRLYKYYANPHVSHYNYIVAYMLLSKLIVMARPGLYREAIDTFNEVYDEQFVPYQEAKITIRQVHIPNDKLWKRILAHDTMPSVEAATNITLTNCEMVDATAAGGPTTPPIPESEPLSTATNIAPEESTKMTEAGRDQLGKKTG
ncbi:hypothetical protein C0992_003732 [Termitomyces sp. T32_za158]|nr:hypothetical protein C0992_003732 [Termitomyces sp. T32_za158]